mmetsp:Transcript_12241/g.36525  ORF Transcript_12241/g.36525 Transcript_12241/m.36525 type:complete len:313 (+) Transcript_12241:552-1490(+)
MLLVRLLLLRRTHHLARQALRDEHERGLALHRLVRGRAPINFRLRRLPVHPQFGIPVSEVRGIEREFPPVPRQLRLGGHHPEGLVWDGGGEEELEDEEGMLHAEARQGHLRGAQAQVLQRPRGGVEQSHVGEDCRDGDDVQEILPDANAPRAPRGGPPAEEEHLGRIRPTLENVVDEAQRGSQRVRDSEEREVAELEHHFRVLVKHAGEGGSVQLLLNLVNHRGLGGAPALAHGLRGPARSQPAEEEGREDDHVAHGLRGEHEHLHLAVERVHAIGRSRARVRWAVVCQRAPSAVAKPEEVYLEARDEGEVE